MEESEEVCRASITTVKQEEEEEKERDDDDDDDAEYTDESEDSSDDDSEEEDDVVNLVSKALNKFMKNILEVKRNKRWIPPRKLKVLRGQNKQEKLNQN